MCTSAFLQDVYDNTIFVFDLVDLRVRNCATIPSLSELQKMAVKAVTTCFNDQNGVLPGSVERVNKLL